jgi:hypothetical protein
MYTSENIISNISALCPILPLVAFTFNFNKSRLILLVVTSMAASLLSEGVNYILTNQGVHHNYIVYNIYFVIEFILVSLIYCELLNRWKKGIYVIIALFILYFIIVSVFFQHLDQYQNTTRTLGGAIIIGCFICAYMNVYFVKPTVYIFTYTPFLINLGIFSYFGFNFFIFVFSTYILENLSIPDQLAFWSVHNVNNILRSVFFTWALWNSNIDHMTPYEYDLREKAKALGKS